MSKKTHKWVEIRPGLHRLVSIDDPRPEDIEWVKMKEKTVVRGAPYLKLSIPWADKEAAIHESPDGKTQYKAMEEFTAERDKWTSTSGKLARYEKDRKDYLEKAKPQYREERIDKLKKAGL